MERERNMGRVERVGEEGGRLQLELRSTLPPLSAWGSLWCPCGSLPGEVWDQDLVLSALRGRRAAPETGPRAGAAELGRAHLPGP